MKIFLKTMPQETEVYIITDQFGRDIGRMGESLDFSAVNNYCTRLNASYRIVKYTRCQPDNNGWQKWIKSLPVLGL